MSYQHRTIDPRLLDLRLAQPALAQTTLHLNGEARNPTAAIPVSGAHHTQLHAYGIYTGFDGGRVTRQQSINTPLAAIDDTGASSPERETLFDFDDLTDTNATTQATILTAQSLSDPFALAFAPALEEPWLLSRRLNAEDEASTLYGSSPTTQWDSVPRYRKPRTQSVRGDAISAVDSDSISEIDPRDASASFSTPSPQSGFTGPRSQALVISPRMVHNPPMVDSQLYWDFQRQHPWNSSTVIHHGAENLAYDPYMHSYVAEHQAPPETFNIGTFPLYMPTPYADNITTSTSSSGATSYDAQGSNFTTLFPFAEEGETSPEIFIDMDIEMDYDCFSFHPPIIPIKKSRSMSTPDAANSATQLALTKRKEKRRLTTGAIDSKPFFIIMEDGQGGLVIPKAARRKGVRSGRLAPHTALLAAETRRNKSTCLRCKIDRQACVGGIPCLRCRHTAQPTVSQQPCVKAQFADIVESGTCNYISQRAINHMTRDKTRRVQMFLPEEFEVGTLMKLVQDRQSRFNFRASQASGPLYVLDLDKCHDFLSSISNTQVFRQGGLREFIDDTLVKTKSWHKCVSDCEPMDDILSILSVWNNMPSRASYEVVPVDGSGPARILDPEDPDDRTEILIAAQLSRIVCRKVEIDGYNALQNVINKLRFNNDREKAIDFVQQFGGILLTLRWRISWWELLGDGSNNDDPFRDRFVHRVRSLSKILYFYYFTAKRKVPSFSNTESLEGITSTYADALPVFDDFPKVESIEWFRQWMEAGKELVIEAGVAQRLSQHKQSSI